MARLHGVLAGGGGDSDSEVSVVQVGDSEASGVGGDSEVEPRGHVSPPAAGPGPIMLAFHFREVLGPLGPAGWRPRGGPGGGIRIGAPLNGHGVTVPAMQAGLEARAAGADGAADPGWEALGGSRPAALATGIGACQQPQSGCGGLLESDLRKVLGKAVAPLNAISAEWRGEYVMEVDRLLNLLSGFGIRFSLVSNEENTICIRNITLIQGTRN